MLVLLYNYVCNSEEGQDTSLVHQLSPHLLKPTGFLSLSSPCFFFDQLGDAMYEIRLTETFFFFRKFSS